MAMLQSLVVARRSTIFALATQAEIALLDPSPQSNTGSRMVCGFRALLDGYIKSVMESHTSSNATYALRDLPVDERESYERALHAIRILEQVYPIATAV